MILFIMASASSILATAK